MILTADLHIHSLFSMAASKNTTPELLENSCRIKGIDVLGSGDAFHPVWRKSWDDFLFESDLSVIPSAEVEGEKKVHHLILMKDFSIAGEISEKLAPYSPNIKKSGRPNVSISAEALSELVHDCGGYIGPAHAFTPWTGMYGRFGSLAECYGEEKPDFLELGLSADTSYGNKISELDNIPFLSNSDAHSFFLHKIGREFNKVDARSKSPKDVLDSVLNGNIVMNAGFFPEEGKYNRTACSKCYRHFTPDEAEKLKWKCPHDGGRIKMGVHDKSVLMADCVTESMRPPYLHIMPLGEIIKEVLNVSSPMAKKCCSLYSRLISEFGNEIFILTEAPVEEISEIDRSTGIAIEKFRQGKVKLIPGGGGMYGRFEI